MDSNFDDVDCINVGWMLANLGCCVDEGEILSFFIVSNCYCCLFDYSILNNIDNMFYGVIFVGNIRENPLFPIIDSITSNDKITIILAQNSDVF